MTGFRFLDPGLDEMAAGARAGFAPRIAATVAVALIVSGLVGWAVTLAWATWATAWDCLSWLWTREQFLGRPVNDGARMKYALTVGAGVAGWTVLGGLLWTNGTAAGAFCAVVIWLAIMGFAQVHAYQTRTGYVLAGLPPAATA